MPRGRPKGSKNWGDSPKKPRGAAEAKLENPETMYHESLDVAQAAELEGRKEGLELLERIKQAGSNHRALAAIQRRPWA